MRSIRAVTHSLWVEYVNYQYVDAGDIKRFGTNKYSSEKNIKTQLSKYTCRGLPC